jgi:hypothetical protein
LQRNKVLFIMVIRSLCILAVVLGLSTNAFAGEHPILHRMSCTMVRYYVALYSAAAAEQYARSKGATDAEIEMARHCVKSDAAQMAWSTR